MSERMCKVCLKIKPRFKNGIIYLDNHGKRWHGITCPECFRQDSAKRNELYRKSGSSKTAVDDSQRLCRKCGGSLDQGRYFTHSSCDPLYHLGGGDAVWTADDWGCGLAEGVRV